MAKFDVKEQTVNRDGYPAYKETDKERLVTAVLTTMFGEPKFYGETDSDIVKLATECAKAEPEFLCRLAVYARTVFNMRSVSHVLTAVIAREASKYTRRTVRNVVVRPDDILEIMSCYQKLYGKPFPNALKKEVAAQLQRFNEFEFGKYNGGKKDLTFKDAVRITHPVPKDKEVERTLWKVVNDALPTPYTWETELSAKGNTAEVWNGLIASGKVGHMALLRNLRNIMQTGADIDPVLEKLSDPEQVRKSRQLPFRYYSAYRAVNNCPPPEGVDAAEWGAEKAKVHDALEKALEVSIEGMETIPGRTLIAVDVSGSMGAPVSARSDVLCCDIASLLGAMAGRICESAEVCYFDCTGSWGRSGKNGYRIDVCDASAPVLDTALANAFAGGGTDLSLPMKYALEQAKNGAAPFDRVVYFSDNECNGSYRGLRKTVQGHVDAYRREYNKDFWVHGIDLQGYGTQQFTGKSFNLIAGWSEKVLPFILLAERGMGSLVAEIEGLDVV